MSKSWVVSAALAVMAAVPVRAAVIGARFNGTITWQAGSAFSARSAISGESSFDMSGDTFGPFAIGGLPAAPPQQSMVKGMR